MIDLIKLKKIKTPAFEIAEIVNRNGLSNNTEAGKPCYSNRKIKNLEQQKGVFIEISVNGTLSVECSLHKYHNETAGKGRQNADLFTMAQAKETIYKLLKDKKINPQDVRVIYYETGLNLELPKDCITYLQKIEYIEKKNGKKYEFIPDQNYKDKRMRTTNKHRSTRLYFKTYDKVFEMQDRQKNRNEKLFIHLLDKNILRIETVYRRVEKHTVETFFNPDNLEKIQKQFFEDWENVLFEREIKAPKNTGRLKKTFCKEILKHGKETVLNKARADHKNGTITEREFRTKREFIQNEWYNLSKKIVLVESNEEKEFKKELSEKRNILNIRQLTFSH